MIKLYNGDCLEVMPKIPGRSVDAVICDPPYNNVKNHNWDNQWGSDNNFLEWMEGIADEIGRLLKPVASLYMFCKPHISHNLINILEKHIPFQSEIVWKKLYKEKGHEGWKNKCNKKSLRRLYPSSERILFHARDSYSLQIKVAREEKGLTVKELTGILGAYKNVNNGGQVSNWEKGRNFPPDKYKEKLENLLDICLEKRKFDATVFNSFEDILEYYIVSQRKGKHPCEKPLGLIGHLVESITKENHIVLDMFMGSGTTGVACKNLNRGFIGIEMDENYFEIAEKRINEI